MSGMSVGVLPAMPSMGDAIKFLDLLSDPARSRKWADDVKAAHEAASAEIEKATKLRALVTAEQDKLNLERTAHEQDKVAHSAFLNSSAAQLDERLQHLVEREAKVQADAAANALRTTELAVATTALDIAKVQVSEEAIANARVRELNEANTRRIQDVAAILERAVDEARMRMEASK